MQANEAELIMPVWIFDIITSEFLWGIVIGLVIATIGAIVQAKLNSKKTVEQQKLDFLLFSQEIVKNIIQVSEDIAEARRRSEMIHHDLLSLIDVEVGIFGRNREHSIRLDNELRSELRKYVTNVALRRLEVTAKLNEYYNKINLADGLMANGNEKQAKELRIEAIDGPLLAANKKTDDLIATAKEGGEIIKNLKSMVK